MRRVVVRSTTIWEQWGAPVLSGGMDSRNHPMFAGPADTMYTRFAGCVRKRNIRRFCLDDATVLVLPRQAQDGQRGDPYVQSKLQRRGYGLLNTGCSKPPARLVSSTWCLLHRVRSSAWPKQT